MPREGEGLRALSVTLTHRQRRCRGCSPPWSRGRSRAVFPLAPPSHRAMAAPTRPCFLECSILPCPALSPLLHVSVSDPASCPLLLSPSYTHVSTGGMDALPESGLGPRLGPRLGPQLTFPDSSPRIQPQDPGSQDPPGPVRGLALGTASLRAC